MKKAVIRSLSLVITAALLLCAVPSSVFAQQVEKGELQIGVMTDVHYYAPENVAPGELDAFEKACRATISSSFLADAMLDCALDGYRQRAERGELDYLLIPGDLTRNGDLVSARKLAEILEKFEEDTGVQVLVADGNHDINNPRAEIFKDGQFIKDQPNMSPEDFKEIFKNLGYDLAIDTFTPPEGKVAGGLSYVAQLDKGYRVIMVDGGKYSFDNTDKGLDKQETGGNYTPEVFEWAVNAIEDCVKADQTPIGMTHWNLVPHFTREINTFSAFCLDNCEEVSEAFADAGMNYVFTGHVHNQDIASHVSDSGNVLYDICTSSLISYPNYVRTVQLDNSDPENITFATQTHDFDETKAMEWNGKTYAQPFKYECFGINFTGESAYEMAIRMADYYVNGNLFEEIVEGGGLYAFLMGSFDLKSVFDNLLSPITFMGINIFSSQNILALIEDLCKQIDEQYIKDPERVMALAKELVDPIVNYKVSDVPCTKFLDTYGFGSRTEGGTLGDLISSILVYYYSGEQDISDDAFFTDVLETLETGEISTGFMNILIDELVDGLIQKELFGTLKLNLAAAFPRGSFGHVLVFCLDATLKALLLGNNTFTNIINKGFGLLNLFKIIDYKNIDDILYHYMDEYLTVSQMETIDGEIKSFVTSMSTDINPSTYGEDGKFIDLECSLSANPNGGYEVEATADNLRLPGLVSVTFGKNACTQKNISWFTKSTVTGTDYQLVTEAQYLSGGFGDKVNVRPSGVSVITRQERTTRSYPGVDIGILGILHYKSPVNRHCLYFSGLQPGTTYYYRIGDAAKGFWSEPAVIKTADAGDSLTFFHMSDPQCGLERQYQNFGTVVDTAYRLFPDSAFIMCTGDQVDHGDNFNQWKWMFGAARDNIMNTAFMPTAGNHEENGTDAIVNYFTLPEYIEQDTEEGVFYSFDYNNAHFIVLNTNNLSKKDALSDEQLQWLKDDAAKSTAQWKIVALHKALYSNGSHYDDDDVVAMRKQLCALMPQLGIDIVLQGHDHVYLRTDAMNSNKVAPVYTTTDSFEGREYDAKVNPDGTIYVIDACSGVKYYKTKDNAQTDKLFPRAEKIVDADSFPVFGAIQIRGNKLYFNSYGVDPETGKETLLDSFEIIKDSSIDTPKFGGRKTLSDIFSFLKAS